MKNKFNSLNSKNRDKSVKKNRKKDFSKKEDSFSDYSNYKNKKKIKIPKQFKVNEEIKKMRNNIINKKKKY